MSDPAPGALKRVVRIFALYLDRLPWEAGGGRMLRLL